MRLIDADALKEQICLVGDCTQCKTGVNEKMCKWDMVQLNEIVERIESAPTIDAVPVVLCKDCEHYDFTDNRVPQERVWWCYYWGCEIGANDFCSYAERKYNG